MMARIRTVKPEFWSSEQVMSSRPLARLLFIGLWNFCDDGGNHPLAPRTIKALVFPGDDITTEEVSELLGELEGVGLTVSYTVDEKTYLHVLGWKHQKIEKKNFKYPPFPQLVVDESESVSGVVVDQSSNGRRPLDPVRDVDVDLEGNGEDQHHSHKAGEEIQVSEPEATPEESSVVAPDPTQAKIALVQPEPEIAREPVDPKAPVEMTLDWTPDANLLKTYCVHFGVSPDLFSHEATASFTAHHESIGGLNTQAKWVSLLVGWVKSDKARASNVRQFPQRRQANGPDFDDTTWSEDLGAM